MKIVSESVFPGPSLFGLVPVVRIAIDVEGFEFPRPGNRRYFLADRLLRFLPGLARYPGLDRQAGTFGNDLRDSEELRLGYVIACIAVELQRMGKLDIAFPASRQARRPPLEEAVFGHWDPDVGLAAGRFAVSTLDRLVALAAAPDPDRETGCNPDDERERFESFVRARSLDMSTAAVVREAMRRDIPWRRLDPQARYIRLGHGRFQRYVHETATDRTSFTGGWMCNDKNLTNRLLMEAGIPVPEQALAADAEQAVTAAEKIGYPVVVKPADGRKGRGVSVGIGDADGVRRAFEEARRAGTRVIVEKLIEGDDHRILVIGGKAVATARRIPGHVIGDGRRTVARLVEIANRDPRRGIGFERLLVRLDLDGEAERLLAGQDMTLDGVPEAGQTVHLRRTANISRGGTAVDVSDVIHPDNRLMAVRAAEALGLDIAGIDFITSDIGRSHGETGGAVCEVNISPGLRPHWVADGGKRDVVGPILDMLYPAGRPGRIPVAAITGTNGKTTTTRMVARILKVAGHTVGHCCTDGAYIDDKLVIKGDVAGLSGARLVLQDKSVDAAVLETARRGILRRGLGFDWCNVGAVLNIDDDHLGMDGIESLDDLARIKVLVVRVTRDMAVLNADDERCVRMARNTSAKRICYVTQQAGNGLVADHIAAGNPAVMLRDSGRGATIVLHDGGKPVEILPARNIPATLDGKATHNVENATFAVAIAHGLGVPVEHIRTALASFACTPDDAPGRLNIYDGLPFRVIVDYAHNPAGLEKINEFVESLAAPERRIVCFKSSGRNPDRQIRNIARAVAGHYDHYVCCRQDDLKGRKPSEVPDMLCDTLLGEGVRRDCISVIPVETEAVAAALDMARPGDLLAILFCDHDRAWQQIVSHRPS